MEVACSTRNTPRPQQPVLARLRGTDASQIVEFAVTLPLLMVFLIGITDFGGAFTLKQKLNNAVREGARFGANEPTSDLDGTQPVSVDAIANLVGHYLLYLIKKLLAFRLVGFPRLLGKELVDAGFPVPCLDTSPGYFDSAGFLIDLD